MNHSQERAQQKMEPQEFLFEFYRRFSERSVQTGGQEPLVPLGQYIDQHRDQFEHISYNYRSLLPVNRDCAILDIGYGPGHFLAACRSWGYTNLTGTEYATHREEQLRAWGITQLQHVTGSVEEFLAASTQQYDVIHAAHLIEHVPRYELLRTMDALFAALTPGGRVLLVTPNMNAPTALGARYITLGHECGFTEQSLSKLLFIAGCDDIRILPVRWPRHRPKLVLGSALRWLALLPRRVIYRLFDGADTKIFSPSIIGRGTRTPAASDAHTSVAARGPV